MRSRIAKWGNSLAVRIPAEYARAVGLREGDGVELEVTASGEIRLAPERPFDKRAFLPKLRKLRASLPAQTEGAGNFTRLMRDADRY